METIKKVFKDLSGSWSIILYDKKTGKCYYWKNNSTSIHFWKGNDCLFISTANQESLLPEGMKKITISSNKIYEIGKDSDPVVVGDMPSVVETVYVYNNSNRVYMGLSDKKSNKKKRQDFLEKVLSEKEAEEEDYCVSCGNIFDVKDIPYSDIWRGRICEECEQQWMKY